MSSTIKVNRICKHCGNEFIAKTTKTLYCSHRCNSAYYKANLRALKIEKSDTETRRIKSQAIEELKEKEFLSVTQVSKLIGCSRQNVYNLINTGKLRATNILLKKTIIKRSDLDNLFIEPNNRTNSKRVPSTPIQQFSELKHEDGFGINHFYTITGVLD